MRKDCGHKLIDRDCVECWKRKVELAESQLAAANGDIERLKAEMEKFKEAANKAVCSYCGNVGEKTISAMSEHLAKCRLHPLSVFANSARDLTDDRDRYKALAAKMAEALAYIAIGKAHIGNDDKGNVFGFPDIVMCRNRAKEALALYQAEKGGRP